MNTATSSYKIDIHAHMIPEFYVKKMQSRGIDGVLWNTFPKWSPQKDMEIMRKNGISKRMISLSIPGVFVTNRDFASAIARECNEYAASLVNNYPDKYGAFATLPFPDIEYSLSEIEYALDILKLDGVTMFSNVQGRYYAEEEYEIIFQELDKRKAIVFLHPEDLDIEYKQYNILAPIIDRCLDTGKALTSLLTSGILAKYKNIKYIAAHGGGSFPVTVKHMEKEGVLLKAFYTDINDRIFYDTAQQGGPLYRYLKEFCGTSQILFGTDGGWQSPVQISQTVNFFNQYAGFTSYEKRSIEYNNPANLFPQLVPQRKERGDNE